MYYEYSMYKPPYYFRENSCAQLDALRRRAEAAIAAREKSSVSAHGAGDQSLHVEELVQASTEQVPIHWQYGLVDHTNEAYSSSGLFMEDFTASTSTGFLMQDDTPLPAAASSSSGVHPPIIFDQEPTRITTLFVRNIPPFFDQDMLLRIWDRWRYSINFLHIPFNVKRGKVRGFAFVNFNSPDDALTFQHEMNGAFIKYGNIRGGERICNKPLEIRPADVQGLLDNLRRCGLEFEHLPAVLHEGVLLDTKEVLQHIQDTDGMMDLAEVAYRQQCATLANEEAEMRPMDRWMRQ